jgi:hypothetical protein
MRFITTIFLFVFFLIGICSFSYSQIRVGYIDLEENSTCDNKLREAQSLYNKGMYFESEKLLNDVLKECEINKARKLEVYELLIKNQLETDDVNGADSSVYKMLKKNPAYELKERNNSENFNRLIKRFDVHPQLTFGVRNSAVRPIIKIKKIYSVLDGVDYSSPYIITSKNHYVAEYYGWIEYGINKTFSLNLEGAFSGFSYSRNFRKGNDWQMEYSESINFFEMPVYVKAFLPLSKNIISYIGAGAGWLKVLSANANAKLTNNLRDVFSGEETKNYLTDENIDVMSIRTKNSFEAIGEIGIGYKIRGFRIFTFARYFKGLNILNSPTHRFDNTLLINKYSYIDNSFVLNKYELGASVSFVLKSSVKKRK